MANVLKSLTNVLRALANHSEIQKQAYPQVFRDIYHSVETISTTDLTDETDECPTGKRRDQKVCCFPLGLRPCSPMRMLSHVSELPCLTLPIRLVCPLSDRKSTKQNSCPWQYKMSLHRRLLTVTLDLRACPIAFLLFYHGFYGLDGIYVAW